jgi:hypothetical protein
MFFELYNSTYDPTYTMPLATTSPITETFYIYRFNFASISTYTGSFATAPSITEIPSETLLKPQMEHFLKYPLLILLVI